MLSPSPDLIQTIADRVEDVRARIAAACLRSDRSTEAVRLIAVTKTHPPETVMAAQAAGLQDFGENRVQELVAKTEGVPGLVQGGRIRWHLIGPLQRNKAKDVALCADAFHALDSVRLAETLERRLEQEDRVLPCFVQINVSDEDTKSGVAPEDAHRLIDELAPFEHLQIVGLMTLAAPVDTADDLERVVRPQFRRLRQLAATYDGPHVRAVLQALSMGMSGDYEVAIEEGATHIRLGSVLFGSRS